MLVQPESVDLILNIDLGIIGTGLNIVEKITHPIRNPIKFSKSIFNFYNKHFDWKMPTIGMGVNSQLMLWSNLDYASANNMAFYGSLIGRAFASYFLRGLFIKKLVDPLADNSSTKGEAFLKASCGSMVLWSSAEYLYFKATGLPNAFEPAALDFVYSLPLIMAYVSDRKGYSWIEHPDYEDANLYLHR